MQKACRVEAKSAKWSFGAFPVAKQDNSICLVQDSWPIIKRSEHPLSMIEDTFFNIVCFLFGNKDGFQYELNVNATTWTNIEITSNYYIVVALWESCSTTGYLTGYRYFSIVDAIIICRHACFTHSQHWWPTSSF